MSSKINVDKRGRSWTFVLYPESMPSDWIDILNSLHTPVVISPLHDKDINPDGTPKKPHYHILLVFDGNKSYTQVYTFVKKLNAPIPQLVENTKGMVRYFIHMDNPEKFQYDKSEMRTLGYVDLESFFEVSYTQRMVLISEMIDYISTNSIEIYADFVDYARNFRRNDWFFVLIAQSTSSFIKDYINSLSYKLKHTDKNTGEIHL